MLCAQGCGQEARYFSKRGVGRCESHISKCPILRMNRSIKIKTLLATVCDDGRTLGQQRMHNTQQKCMADTNDDGILKSKARSAKALETLRTTIDPETGYTLFELRLAKAQVTLNQPDPVTGLNSRQKSGVKGGSTRKNMINAVTGETIAKSMAMARMKTMREDVDELGVDAIYRKNKRSAETKKSTIGEDGLSIAQRAGIKDRTNKLKNIDERGLNAYDRAALKGKSVFYYENSESLYYQGSYERRFLQDSEQIYGSTAAVMERIIRCPHISYYDPNTSKYRVFRPDFFDTQTSTAYEVKSTFVMRQEGGFVNLAAKLDAANTLFEHVVLVLDHQYIPWNATNKSYLQSCETFHRLVVPIPYEAPSRLDT